MASFTYTVPDEKANKLFLACKKAYKDAPENPTNAEKLAYVKSKGLKYYQEILNAYDISEAEDAAKAEIVLDTDVIS